MTSSELPCICLPDGLVQGVEMPAVPEQAGVLMTLCCQLLGSPTNDEHSTPVEPSLAGNQGRFPPFPSFMRTPRSTVVSLTEELAWPHSRSHHLTQLCIALPGQNSKPQTLSEWQSVLRANEGISGALAFSATVPSEGCPARCCISCKVVVSTVSLLSAGGLRVACVNIFLPFMLISTG